MASRARPRRNRCGSWLTRALRPLRVPGSQFDRYTAAVRYLDPPKLFENRPSYRLLGLAWAGCTGAMRFGLATYFDKLDISEAIGHEIAEVRSRQDAEITGRDLPFRSLIDDPLDFRRRAILPAITTLTLRRANASQSFLLHFRDPEKVATAAGIFDVIPAGEFQPSSIAPHDLANDFDIWKNIVREYSEELLGTPEYDGTRSDPIDYDGWPLYRLFGETVRYNSEGEIIFGEPGKITGHGIEFTERNVTGCSNASLWPHPVPGAWRWHGGEGSPCSPGNLARLWLRQHDRGDSQ